MVGSSLVGEGSISPSHDGREGVSSNYELES